MPSRSPSFGATAASSEAHSNRLDSTASGCLRSIIWSRRDQTKSGVLIVNSLRNPPCGVSNSGDNDSKIHAAKRVFIRGVDDLQDRLVTVNI
jgi:hypothetical protein